MTKRVMEGFTIEIQAVGQHEYQEVSLDIDDMKNSFNEAFNNFFKNEDVVSVRFTKVYGIHYFTDA